MPLKIGIDTRSLVEFTKQIEKAGGKNNTQLAVGLNEIGDNLVSLVASDLTKKTGLSLEEVRGMMKVSRANRSKLHYDVTVKKDLLDPPKGQQLEAKREDRDFGKRRPGQLVIVVTQKDDLVCMDCQELEAAGPMPVEIANEHIPRHPHCRCVILPYVQKGKRLPVTMTSTTGTSSKARSQTKTSPMEEDLTLRQLAQDVINRTASKVRLELLK
jgi:hypothetical protein